MNQAKLEASELYRFYHVADEEIFALRGVSLQVRSGELIAVTGPSGSGKSTLLNCITGLDEPDGGYVKVSGERISRAPERVRARLRARHIGIMMQSGNLFPHLPLIDNVRLQQQLSEKKGLAKPESLLERVGLSHRVHALPQTISGGEAARAALAVALSAAPSVLICDEPTGEVDLTNEAAILSLFQDAQEDGTAILIATHSLSLAGKADRIVRLNDGAIV